LAAFMIWSAFSCPWFPRCFAMALPPRDSDFERALRVVTSLRV
jgi:hypothetical protein